MGDDLVSGQVRARAAYTAESVISPLEGEMAGRPEGVASRRVPTSYCSKGSPPVEPTPSVAFGDISPSRGEITLFAVFTNLQPSVAACRLEGHDILDPLTILMEGALLLRGVLM